MKIDNLVLKKVLEYQELKKEKPNTQEKENCLYKKMKTIETEICGNFKIENSEINRYSFTQDFCNAILKLEDNLEILEIILLNDFMAKWEDKEKWLFNNLSCEKQQENYFKAFYNNIFKKEKNYNFVCVCK